MKKSLCTWEICMVIQTSQRMHPRMARFSSVSICLVNILLFVQTDIPGGNADCANYILLKELFHTFE